MPLIHFYIPYQTFTDVLFIWVSLLRSKTLIGYLYFDSSKTFGYLLHCMGIQYELAFILGRGADGGRVQLSEKAAGPVTAV